MHLTTLLTTLSIFTTFSTAQVLHHTSSLRADIYHLPPKPVQYQNVTLQYSPSTFTLVHSPHEAVLVDAPTLSSDASHLASWIADKIPGKKLKYIYITHAHADHFNGFPAILSRFPEAQVITTAKVLHHLPAQYASPLWDQFWQGLFPGLEQANLSLVHALPASLNFSIRGAHGARHEFRAIEVGQGDTADSTVLHVPELALVVGGDVVYGHCYQYLVENPTRAQRDGWIAALEGIKALEPRVVVPSHAKVGEGYGVEHLAETQEYIRGWEGLLGEAGTWEELEEKAERRWPDRIGSLILRYTAQSFFDESG